MQAKSLIKGAIYGLLIAIFIILWMYVFNLMSSPAKDSFAFLFFAPLYLSAPAGLIAEKIVGSNSNALYGVLLPLAFFIYYILLGVLSLALWKKNKKWQFFLFIFVLIIIHAVAYHFWDWFVIGGHISI